MVANISRKAKKAKTTTKCGMPLDSLSLSLARAGDATVDPDSARSCGTTGTISIHRSSQLAPTAATLDAICAPSTSTGPSSGNISDLAWRQSE